MDHSQLRKVLLEKEYTELSDYKKILTEPNTDTLILINTHLVIEKLLGSMISTRLMDPDVWLDGSNYRSKSNLAKAMGLIGQRELHICREINKIRNRLAHSLDGINDNWQKDIRSLAYGESENNPNKLKSIDWVSRDLLSSIAGAWLHTKLLDNKRKALAENRERWIEVMKKKLYENIDLLYRDLNSETINSLVNEVDELVLCGEKAPNSN